MLMTWLMKTFGYGMGTEGDADTFQEEQLTLFSRFCQGIKRYWNQQRRDGQTIPATLASDAGDTPINSELIRAEIRNRETRSVLLKSARIQEQQEYPKLESCIVRTFLNYLELTQRLHEGDWHCGERNTVATFWKTYGKQFPLLLHPAKLLMSIPPSIFAAEGSFSISGWLRGHRRTRLHSSRLKEMMLVRYGKLGRLDDETVEEEEDEN